MSLLHIVGFGTQLKPKLKVRWKWYQSFPDGTLNIEPNDAVILNLVEVHNGQSIKELERIVDFIGQKGGILFVVAAPIKNYGKVSNYHFLPWPERAINGIHIIDGSAIRAEHNAPSWVQSFIRCIREEMIAPVFFQILPSGAHVLMRSAGGSCVCFNYRHKLGKILILPSIQSVIHGEKDSTAKYSLVRFLKCLDSNILFRFEEIMKPPPDWLDSILVRNEGDLRTQYESLGGELDRLTEEKSILADDGHSLTRKVASHLEWLGFQTKEKEIEGYEDIEISEGEFRAVVECSGAIGQIKIDKHRQLLEYIMNKGARGILIGNPWREKHPRNRDLSKAFSPRVLRSAERLGVCLVTVPHLYRVCLDIQSDEEKASVRDSLKNCEGLWQYPANDWT